MVIVEVLKIHIVEIERCQRHPRTHASSQFSFQHSISESVSPSDSYPETPTSSMPPTTSTSSSTTSASLPASVLQTSPSSTGSSGPPYDSPANFSSGALKSEGKTATRTTDSVSAWDELMSSSRKTLFSSSFQN